MKNDLEDDTVSAPVFITQTVDIECDVDLLIDDIADQLTDRGWRNLEMLPDYVDRDEIQTNQDVMEALEKWHNDEHQWTLLLCDQEPCKTVVRAKLSM